MLHTNTKIKQRFRGEKNHLFISFIFLTHFALCVSQSNKKTIRKIFHRSKLLVLLYVRMIRQGHLCWQGSALNVTFILQLICCRTFLINSNDEGLKHVGLWGFEFTRVSKAFSLQCFSVDSLHLHRKKSQMLNHMHENKYFFKMCINLICRAFIFNALMLNLCFPF